MVGGKRTSRRALGGSRRLISAAVGSAPRRRLGGGIGFEYPGRPVPTDDVVGAPAVGSSSQSMPGSPRSFPNSAAARSTAAAGAGLGMETRRPALAGTTQRSSASTSPGLTLPWPTTRAMEPLRPSEEAISTVTAGWLTVLSRHLGNRPMAAPPRRWMSAPFTESTTTVRPPPAPGGWPRMVCENRDGPPMAGCWRRRSRREQPWCGRKCGPSAPRHSAATGPMPR
jgi:hypothetical protein